MFIFVNSSRKNLKNLFLEKKVAATADLGSDLLEN